MSEPVTPRTSPCADIKAQVRDLLERLPLDELHLLRLYTIPGILRRRVAELARREGMDFESGLLEANPVREVNDLGRAMVGIADVDEDGDEVLEATPLADVKPIILSDIEEGAWTPR